jgi:hypothetical protein
MENRYSISKAKLHQAVLRSTRTYLTSQDRNGNGVIDKNEISPVIGKLIPRGVMIRGELIGDWK